MGVTIRCAKTNSSIDLSYMGFARLRMKIAELAGGPFSDHYRKLMEKHCPSEEFLADWDAATLTMLNQKQADIKIVDFLLQSDCDGSVNYGACKNILRVIGDSNDNTVYGYAGQPDPATMNDFKQILKECVEHQCKMKWC